MCILVGLCCSFALLRMYRFYFPQVSVHMLHTPHGILKRRRCIFPAVASLSACTSDAHPAGFWRDQVDLWAERCSSVRLVRRPVWRFRRWKVLAATERGGAGVGDSVVHPDENCTSQTFGVRNGESSRGESFCLSQQREKCDLGACCCCGARLSWLGWLLASLTQRTSSSGHGDLRLGFTREPYAHSTPPPMLPIECSRLAPAPNISYCCVSLFWP